jgi:hypothetical protein
MLQADEAVRPFEPMPGKPDATVTKTFRLPGDLAERLEAYAEALARDTGVPVSQNAALAKLLREALDAAERKRS